MVAELDDTPDQDPLAKLLSAVAPASASWRELERVPDGTFNPVISDASPLRMSAFKTSKDPVEAADPEKELDTTSSLDPDKVASQDPDIPDIPTEELIVFSGWIPVSSDPSPSRKSTSNESKDPVEMCDPLSRADV